MFLQKPLIFALIFFIGLILTNCSESYYVLNHQEIKRAYGKSDPLFLPGLKKVILNENRDIKAAALYYLGRYYSDYLNLDVDDITEASKEEQLGIENFMLEYYKETKDYNLKNIISTSLTYSEYLAPNKTLPSKITKWTIDEFTTTPRLEIKLHLLQIIKDKLERNHLTLDGTTREKLQQEFFTLLNNPKVNHFSKSFQTILDTLLVLANKPQLQRKIIKDLLTQFDQPYHRVLLNQYLIHYQTATPI